MVVDSRGSILGPFTLGPKLLPDVSDGLQRIQGVQDVGVPPDLTTLGLTSNTRVCPYCGGRDHNILYQSHTITTQKYLLGLVKRS